ncbi:hypothetical protein GCM10025859_04310 [Alicyclobacillus fastidiosus]|nr:hypothetical protein GCM10025859_04310 [Alicyclobacillus fastidiosus]
MRANGGDDLKAGAQDSNTIQVDVHGDVVHPGVVTVPWNSRVDDAIEAAGGFRDKADAMDVNSAALVWDGEEIDVPGQMGAQARAMTSSQVARATEQSLVPSPEANGVSDAPSGEGKPLVTDKIDLNTADEATLETLPRVGPKRAADIVAYRQAHGPFQSVSDLLNVKGIGPKTLSLWAPNLYVASALAPKEDR